MALMKAVINGQSINFPEGTTPSEINHVMNYATDAQLEAFFSKPNNANQMAKLFGTSEVQLLNDISANDKKIASLEKKIGLKRASRKKSIKKAKEIEKLGKQIGSLKKHGAELKNELDATGSDFNTALDKKAILQRFQSRPQLAALIMANSPSQSNRGTDGLRGMVAGMADAGLATGDVNISFFKQLGAVAQNHVMGQLPDDQVASLVGSALQEVGSGDNQPLSIIASAAQKNPGAFQTAVDNQTDMSLFLDALDGSTDTKQTKAILAQLTPAQVGSLAKVADKDENKEYANLGPALRESNPSAYLGSFMDNSNVESFQDEFKAAFTTSSGSMDWQAIGEAGNKNPKLMAKVLDQLGAPIGGAGLSGQLAGLADAGQSMSQQIVLAMANQNILAFTLNFDSMPAQIRNQVVTGEVHSHSTASDVPQPPESQQAPGDVAPSTTVAAGPTLNKQAQIRLLGLTMGVSASLLTGPNAEHAVQEQLTSTLLDPNVSTDTKASIKAAIKGLGNDGVVLQAQADLVDLLNPEGDIRKKLVTPSKVEEEDLKRITSILAFADPNMIPGDNIEQLGELTSNIKQLGDLTSLIQMALEDEKKPINDKRLETGLKALNTMLCMRGYAMEQESQSGEDGLDALASELTLLQTGKESNFLEQMGLSDADVNKNGLHQAMANTLKQDLRNSMKAVKKGDVQTSADLALLNSAGSDVNRSRTDVLIKNLEALNPW